MPSRTLDNVGMTAFFDLGEDGWNDEMDLNLLALDTLVQGNVQGILAGELVSPVAGDRIILDEAHPTFPNHVAVYDNGGWVYFSPVEGWLLYDQTNAENVQFDGTVWVALATGGASYPSFTGNAGKVLAVNGTEDGVEWVTVSGGGGGGGTAPEFNIYRHEVAAAVNGGQPVAGSWQTRPLNAAHLEETAGVSLASDQITLPAGKYKFTGFQTFYNTDYTHTRLYNVTDAAVLVTGATGYPSDTTEQACLTMDGVFEIADTKVIELQYRVTSASNINGFGVGNGTVETAIFAQAMFEKVA